MWPKLLPALPAADAAFVGWEFLRSLTERGHHCLIPAGKNVTLLRKLGYHVQEQGDPSISGRRTSVVTIRH